jgi:hypothetical protein
MTGLINIESVYAQESLGVDAQETEVTEADHLSFRLSLFLPDNPCEVEMEPVSTPGESPKPTAKLASPKVQAFTTQYAILLSIRARDFPFGDANMNVFGTLPEVLTITHLLTHSPNHLLTHSLRSTTRLCPTSRSYPATALSTNPCFLSTTCLLTRYSLTHLTSLIYSLTHLTSLTHSRSLKAWSPL